MKTKIKSHYKKIKLTHQKIIAFLIISQLLPNLMKFTVFYLKIILYKVKIQQKFILFYKRKGKTISLY